MRAVAVVLTFGRAELSELLACWDRQTRRVPMVVWVDDAPWLRVEQVRDCDVLHGRAFAGELDDRSVASVRNAAIAAARQLHQLDADDVIMILDDDDFYTAAHAEVTLRPFDDSACEWVSGLAIGLESSRTAPPQYLCAEGGVGQHATWAYRVGAYDRAQHYQSVDVSDDPQFGRRMGWHRCRPHWHCTHVRSHHGSNLSGPTVAWDRAKQRAMTALVPGGIARPEWSERCERLSVWCASHFTPRAAKRAGAPGVPEVPA